MLTDQVFPDCLSGAPEFPPAHVSKLKDRRVYSSQPRLQIKGRIDELAERGRNSRKSQGKQNNAQAVSAALLLKR